MKLRVAEHLPVYIYIANSFVHRRIVSQVETSIIFSIMASPSAPETRTLASAFVASEDTCPTVASLPVPTSPSSHAARVTRSRPSSARVAARALVAASATVEAAAPRATKPKKTAKSCGQPRKRARTATSSKKAPVEDEEEDSKPAATESCCICMSDVETDDLAKISGCDHLFCFGCIEKWAERENSCPLCKIRFTKIDRVNKKRKKGQSNTKRVKQRDQRSDLPGSALESLLGKHQVPYSDIYNTLTFF